VTEVLAHDKGTPRPGGPGGTAGMLSVDELRNDVETGAIDTVVTAFTDMQGRLFGKRIQAEYFLDDVTEHGIEGCNYLLALDMEMDPVPG
jgi:glutamine synthetase